MYEREDAAARKHPIYLAREKKAKKAVEALRKKMRKKAQKLTEQAEKMLREAREIEYQCNR